MAKGEPKEVPIVFRRADRSLNTISTSGVSAVSTTRPRNVERPFRGDDDEPADRICYLAKEKVSWCQDGRDRSKCSRCARGIQSLTLARDGQATIDTPDPRLRPHPISSPDRAFRDLINNQVGNPFRPSVKAALLQAFSRARSFSANSSTCTSSSEQTFHLFPRFPFEIRRLIWEKALPTRLLYHSDLSHSYPGDAVTPSSTTRPVSISLRHGSKSLSRQKAHSINELWRSDLFYTCVEARRVVVEAARGSPRIGRTSFARLGAGRDELYFPWLGRRGTFLSQTIGDDSFGNLLRDLSLRKKNNGHSGELGRVEDQHGDGSVLPAVVGGGSIRSWTKQLERLERVVPPLPVLVLDVGWLDSMNPATLEWVARGKLEMLKLVVADIVMTVPLSPLKSTASTLRKHLDGMDMTMLVDLFDNPQIEELLLLCGEVDASQHHDAGLGCDGFNGYNKAARHLCIDCTRHRWEGRRWERFGRVFGTYLKRLCRPAIIFSITFKLHSD